MGEAVQCHFSVILYEATEEGWKGGGNTAEVSFQRHICGFYVLVWLKPGKRQLQACMLSEHVYCFSLQQITFDT